MSITADELDRVNAILDGAITFDDLAHRDWRRQTDAVKDSFAFARMCVDLGNRAYFVDARISHDIIRRAKEAHEAGKSLKGFINGRCHDAGLNMRRLIVLDSKTSNKMIDRRGNSWGRLHIHGVFELSDGWELRDLYIALKKAFGDAKMGNHQFRISPVVVKKADLTSADTKQCSLNQVTARGPLGKMFYALAHAGTTYATLGLNDGGRRSRKTPWQGAINKKAGRLARGVPSNFNREATIIDQVSARAGREAFEAWIRWTRERRSRHRGEGLATKPTRSLRRRTGTDG